MLLLPSQCGTVLLFFCRSFWKFPLIIIACAKIRTCLYIYQCDLLCPGFVVYTIINSDNLVFDRSQCIIGFVVLFRKLGNFSTLYKRRTPSRSRSKSFVWRPRATSERASEGTNIYGRVYHRSLIYYLLLRIK